ncbi:vacuolar protein sorting-associated protein 13-like [Anopheles albimanus]|uniref:vacuolar protein sorting-associated protein 13-like n=1 Tax=Anopheles albimanus TaxID=7167 RepID=UPI00163F7297|nr:vacuolar protein sorting-associated protein 13-like [Anopheles albimanus]
MRLRPPRFLHKDGIVRPYNRREAEGHKFLREIDKGKFWDTDTYAYYEMIIENKDVVVLTDNRIIYASKSDMFGGWQSGWSHKWFEVLGISMFSDGIEILLRNRDKSALKKMFSPSGVNKKFYYTPSSPPAVVTPKAWWNAEVEKAYETEKIADKNYSANRTIENEVNAKKTREIQIP